jgi:hypothetical protein
MGILTANRHTKTSKIRQLQAIMLLYPVSHAQLATLSPTTNSTDSDNPYTTTLSTNPMITTAPASPLSPRPQIIFRPRSYRLQESRSEADILFLSCHIQLHPRHLRLKHQDSWHLDLLGSRLYLPCRPCGIVAYACTTVTCDPEL